MEVLLLPGMDGTGKLYSSLIAELSGGDRKSAPQYPTDVPVSYEQLLHMLQETAPERPFLLVAESYSTPLAIRYAATRPDRLVGLVLCAGFASSPVRGWRRIVARLLCPILFRLPLSNRMIDLFLLGGNADPSLLGEVRTAIASVKPAVLAARFNEILECEVRADLENVTVPMLYLQAQDDRLVGPLCLEEMLKVRGDIVVQQLPGPHLLLQREPVRAARIIEEFANGLGRD